MDTVETERLLLRPWTLDDVEALAAVFAEPDVWRYPFGRALTREETEGFVEREMGRIEARGFGMWAAWSKADGALAGFVGLTVPEWLPDLLPSVAVGWRLHPAYWGRGLATEGGRASLGYGFERLGLDRIIGIYDPANEASGRVMDRLGMVPWRETVDPVRGSPLSVREVTAEQWRSLG